MDGQVINYRYCVCGEIDYYYTQNIESEPYKMYNWLLLRSTAVKYIIVVPFQILFLVCCVIYKKIAIILPSCPIKHLLFFYSNPTKSTQLYTMF